jgi:hypothetical protein
VVRWFSPQTDGHDLVASDRAIGCEEVDYRSEWHYSLRQSPQLSRNRNNMSATRVSPFFEYQFPHKEYIFVQQENQTRHPMTVDEFNRQFGVSIQHGVFYERRYADRAHIVRQALLKKTHEYHHNNQQLLTYLNNPKNYFSVCYLDDACGYGLVANEDIPAGTVVGTYSGLLVMREDNEDVAPLEERAYDMGYGKLSPIIVKEKEYYITLRANKVSDITRFAIHLPTQAELSQLESQLGSGIAAKNVLTANLEFPVAIIDGAPIHYYVTTKPIKKGEVAGISYGPTYWKSRGKPHLLVHEADGLRIAAYNNQSGKYEKSANIKVKLNDPSPPPMQAYQPAFPMTPQQPAAVESPGQMDVDSPSPSRLPLINNSQLIRQVLAQSRQRVQGLKQINHSEPTPPIKRAVADVYREQTSYAAFRARQARTLATRIQPEKKAAALSSRPAWKI